jgi:hypothetical protein
MTETPQVSAAMSYGNYTIPSLYLSFETTDVSKLRISVLFGFDALKRPDEVKKAEEEAKKRADENRIKKRRIVDKKKPQTNERGPDKMLQTKRGGAIWRAEFLTAMKEAQSDKPTNNTGQMLHALSSD